MKRNLLHLLVAWPILMGLVQCKHPANKEAMFLGPEITPEDFFVLDGSFTAAFSSIDFQKGVQYFKASFSTKVKWYITIKGQESAAIKKLAGIGTTLDTSSSSWAGEADSVFLFKKGEKCTATLTFWNSALTLSTDFSIHNEKKYDGLLVDDFEMDTSIEKIGIDTSFIDTEDSTVEINFGDYSTKVQGEKSLLLSGWDKNANYWIGGVQTRTNGLATQIVSNNSATFYVNLSVYGTVENQAGLNLKFYEDDNGSGRYESANDDAYSYLLKVDWIGWKRISIPYNLFSDDNTATGNDVANPSQLLTMNMTLVAFTTMQVTRLNVDYVLLSSGTPMVGAFQIK